uniref:IF rod domain-containing protein n=1 Tax=Erpetoichthys calabaricus TaxID=27687 RepID=A0A8C4TM22_ERPCA
MTASFSSRSLVLGSMPTAVSQMINGRTSMSRMMPSFQPGTGGFGGPVSRQTLTKGLAAALGNGEVNTQSSSPDPYTGLVGIKPSDKENMQNLNARLATYLKTVHSLEAANARLEKQICDFMQERLAKQGNDYSAYEKTISDLQTQVGINSFGNILLEITNSQLNLEDKKNTFQNEQDLRYQAERDVALLKTMLHTLSQTKTELEVQVKSLQDEIDDLKSNHRREIEAISHLRKEESITVQVEDIASTDLTNALADIRSEYENFISKQRRQTEAWSNSKATTFSQAMAKSGTDAQSSNSQVTNLTVQVQALEIELQLCHRMNKSLEDILQSTESSYSDKLREHQQRAAHLEDELRALRDDIQRQAQDYQVLLDIKNHLETEITDYRRLLDGQETSERSR